MGLHSQRLRGYSLIELLIVMTILGVLLLVGISSLGNRQGAAVRTALDELEGVFSNARQAAGAHGRDVAVVNWGSWSSSNPLIIAYGDAALSDSQIQTTAQGLLNSTMPASTLAYGQTVAVPFHLMINDVNHSRARIVLAGSTDWSIAMQATDSGSTNQDLTEVVPFKSGGSMAGLITDANNLFNASLQRTVINGTGQRFNSTFCIEIVGTSGGGGALPGAPMGLLVGLANGASIYKFYNPGSREGNGKWRRI